MNDNNGKLKYFDYCNLARQEYDNLLKVHPELSALSPREMEVFEKLLTDKTLSEISKEMFAFERIGITAGASTPDELICAVENKLGCGIY